MYLVLTGWLTSKKNFRHLAWSLPLVCCKWFEPRSHIIVKWSTTVSQSTVSWHITLSVDTSQLSVDQLSVDQLVSWSHQGSTDSRPITSRISWPMTSATGVLIVSTDVTQITWLWRWLPLRFSKRQSMSSQTVFLRTTLTRTIVLLFVVRSSLIFCGVVWVVWLAFTIPWSVLAWWFSVSPSIASLRWFLSLRGFRKFLTLT